MPFLYVLPKRSSVDASRGDDVDPRSLAALLCPYRGEVRRFEAGRGTLYVSSIAGVGREGEGSPITCVIPARSRKNPQTAWLEIAITSDGARFETDPLGTFPLWYMEDDERIVVTSEVKSLLAIDGVQVTLEPGESLPRRRSPDFSPYRNVRRVRPGAVFHVSSDRRVTVEGRSPLTYRPASMITSADDARALLDASLRASASSLRGTGGSDERWGGFLSGGIDSSIAAALTERIDQTFTLGTSLGDEYADAEEVAAALGVEHVRVSAAEADARAHFERAVFCNETTDGLTAETLAQLGVLARAASSRSVRAVVTGYGADLLFGSMLRHELYMKVTGVDDLQSLIERTSWSGEFSPFYAWSLGIEVHHLFWDPAVMNTAFRIPPEASFDGAREKVLLRDLATKRGYLSEPHAHRPKRALTDGTQFHRVCSAAFGLTEPYAYDAKNALCFERLRRIFAGPGRATPPWRIDT